MNVEDTMLQAQRAKKLKKIQEQKDSPSTVKHNDIFLVVHKDEYELIEDLVYSLLEDKSADADKKRVALNLLKIMEVAE